jgi:hypothetical protein|nr:MAG TPA: hypothetical protein [Caudoviricetes sp.]
MLRINELVASGESVSVRRPKRRSTFFESASIVIGNKILKTRWDAYQLTKIISGESSKFGDKVKKLFNDTVTWIKKVCKWIWRKIKKIGRFFKYLFTGKIKDFKNDEAWREAAEKMADEVENVFSEMNTKEFQSKVAKEMSDLYGDVINEMTDTTSTMRDRSKSYKEQAKSMDDFLNNMSKATEDITDYVEKKEREVVIDEVVEAEILSASQMTSSIYKATSSTEKNIRDYLNSKVRKSQKEVNDEMKNFENNKNNIKDNIDKRHSELNDSLESLRKIFNKNDDENETGEQGNKSSTPINKKMNDDIDKASKDLDELLDSL